MKKKTGAATLAGLALAALAFLRLSVDLPIYGDVPPEPPDPKLPDRFTECPAGQERKLIGGQWRCWPKEIPPGR